MHIKEKLTDLHVHLEQYTPAESENVLKRANSVGVRWIVTAGMDLQSSAQAVKIISPHTQRVNGKSFKNNCWYRELYRQSPSAYVGCTGSLQPVSQLSQPV